MHDQTGKGGGVLCCSDQRPCVIRRGSLHNQMEGSQKAISFFQQTLVLFLWQLDKTFMASILIRLHLDKTNQVAPSQYQSGCVEMLKRRIFVPGEFLENNQAIFK